ncbi:uncharacterized protein LOC125765797 [Anopheles funestus]|uniref:Uncharacterized protein n=1 Tax=Anopheles funestus TaxID=62324 RepID=A0A1I8JUC7_ANOFN|nr:uncharacterized protein LOC125765797 [Anopheles funestus]
MSSRAVLVSIVVQSIVWLALYAAELPQSDDPFQDETNLCQIIVSEDMMKSLGNAMETDVKCDNNLWSNFLQQYHQTRQNLTDCMERVSVDNTPDPSNVFCQQLLDDAERQMKQEHRKHSAGLERKLHTAQKEAQKQYDQKVSLENRLNRLLNERTKLVLDLMLANIAIGDIKQALINYREYPKPASKEAATKLHEQIVQSVYRVTIYQDQRLLNLIKFVQQIEDANTKVALYRLIMVEIKKRPNQRNGYIAAVFALTVKGDSAVYSKDQQLYTDLMIPLEKRWKDQLANGNYKEVIDFAAQQPTYYEQIQTDLATVDVDKWNGLQFDKFVPYPNSLRKPEQRLEALRQIMVQIFERNKQNPQQRLIQTAKQLDICEQFMNKMKAGPNARRQLNDLKLQFPKFTSGRDYNYYLGESRKAKG